ncbi:SH3 domain-containing protein [Thalassorhabdomicrobium marinisediminis]|uniref:SH3b domain-containing protein n=1 Tax=Thalassorhabdomicrobium marinisediminis TaxID=2170577 RepID=A0A2T7FW70_9RHOB|nr:SH3 domain-containing protein [Thalassorhabdomicrobium marinisediminis]PVA06398.1 hypothetical protein DC363_10870 [Thalassorhabdomicrobium marinisediminis]
MKSYVWLTFGFMGWAFYEASGGADFVPEQRRVADAEIQQEAPEMVTRADTTTLLSVSASNIVASPPAPDATQIAAVAQKPATPADAMVVKAAAPAAAPQIDLREVAGSRVNMRIGPGTNHDVITTLDGGTELEVLEVNADGWANVTTTDHVYEGWMAARLLSDPQI